MKFRTLTNMRWIFRCGIAVLLLVDVLPFIRAQTPPPPGRTYPVRGRMWPESDLRVAYQKIRPHYAVTPGSRRIVAAGELKAFPLQGKIRDRLRAGRLLVERSDGHLVALQSDLPAEPVADSRLDLMVCLNGTPRLSYESATDKRRSLPFYQDVTVSFEEFVTSLQRGYHYSEAPELGTQDSRKGLFRIRPRRPASRCRCG